MGALDGFLWSRLELPSMLFRCLDLGTSHRILLENDMKTVLEIGPNRATSNIFIELKKKSVDKFAPITIIGRV